MTAMSPPFIWGTEMTDSEALTLAEWAANAANGFFMDIPFLMVERALLIRKGVWRVILAHWELRQVFVG
jgi:hypothetical protein